MLVLGSRGRIIVGVRVGLLVPVAGGVGDDFPFLGEDLGRHHLFDSEGLFLSDFDLFGGGNVDHDLGLANLRDHDLSLVHNLFR